jgi:hypothetical protein
VGACLTYLLWSHLSGSNLTDSVRVSCITRQESGYTYSTPSHPSERLAVIFLMRLLWSHLSGSNRRPTVYKTVALPTELRWQVLSSCMHSINLIGPRPCLFSFVQLRYFSSTRNVYQDLSYIKKEVVTSFFMLIIHQARYSRRTVRFLFSLQTFVSLQRLSHLSFCLGP